MAFELGDGEIAVILRPGDYLEDGSWEGDVHTGIAINQTCEIPEDIISQLVGVATMMATFIEVAADNPILYDAVERQRDMLLSDNEYENDPEEGEEEKPKVTKDGNILSLDAWTKTKGNA